MAIVDPPDTLAFHQSRVFTLNRAMGHVGCGAVASRVNAFMNADKEGNTTPEVEALWFYGMNHIMAMIGQRFAPYEPLPPEVNELVSDYHRLMVPKAVRAFYYLLLICTRESRHVHSTATFYTKMGKEFGQPVIGFNSAIKGTGSAKAYKAFLSSPPNATIGEYCRSLQYIFYKGNFSGGFGGPAWGAVADCLTRFVLGEFSAEMMMDTNWTLCHNNGPIFNKGMLYGHYNASKLIRILDVQRSGQIPEMILTDDAVSPYVDNDLRNVMIKAAKLFPGEVKEYVDWFVVEALGAQHAYPHEKKTQQAKYGMSAMASEAEKKAAMAEKAAMEQAAKQAAEHAKKWFTVMPGVEIPKIDRDAA